MIEALIVKAEPQIYGYALRNYEMNYRTFCQIIENGGIQPYPGAFDRVKEVKSYHKKNLYTIRHRGWGNKA